MFIVKPTLTEEESNAQIDVVKEIITKNGGEIEATWDMGTRQLAYPIEKHSRGRYFVVYFKSSPELIKELQRNYKIIEDIIRFLVIKYVKKYEVENWATMVAVAKNGGKAPETQNKKEEPKEEDSSKEDTKSAEEAPKEDTKPVDGPKEEDKEVKEPAKEDK
jgi:small subunit ribosomal protein S6